MQTEIQKSLEAEFKLPFDVIAEIGEARRTDDLYANGFGSNDVYQDSPVSKCAVYEKHGLSFEQGEAIGWAYIWEGINA